MVSHLGYPRGGGGRGRGERVVGWNRVKEYNSYMLDERIGSIGSNLITLPRNERGERERKEGQGKPRAGPMEPRKKKEFYYGTFESSLLGSSVQDHFF